MYMTSPGGRFRYHQDPTKTEAAWRGESYTLGDVGHLDTDGYLYLTDRAADVVIRGGVNIYPAEIEQVLATHPAVVDCAVFGVPDERSGEAIRALVELRTPTDAADLIEHCRSISPPTSAPRRSSRYPSSRETRAERSASDTYATRLGRVTRTGSASTEVPGETPDLRAWRSLRSPNCCRSRTR